MRIKVLFAALLLMLSVCTAVADPIELRIKCGEGTSRPRSGVPISASFDNDIITTEVSGYIGAITVTIRDEDGEVVLTTVESVSYNSQFSTNIASLEDGTYTIFYSMSNNTVFYGGFEK